MYDNLHRAQCLICLIICTLALGCDDQPNPRHQTQASDLGGERPDQGDPLDRDPLDLGASDRDPLDLGASELGLPDAQPPTPWAPVSDVDGSFWVRVTLDGAPLPEALIKQGGSARAWRTDEEGVAFISLDLKALDELTVFASHETARTRALKLSATQREPVELELRSADPRDEPSYPFSDPGEPSRRPSTSQCGHCHLNNNDAWFESPHRRAAQNPTVYDLYMGRASGLHTEALCLERGGRWALAQREGTDEEAWQCFQDISALGAFNERCVTPPCDTRSLAREEGSPERWGGCADCHAPAINGVSGGSQDLLTARGHAFDYGVSCDLCHHVAQVDWSAPAGVGGRLSLWRPSEDGPITLGGGGYLPLSFGPSPDVSNPRMGISPRAHFRNGELCGGCHQHNHQDEHTLDPLDEERWPQGALPNQSTYAEWRESPVSDIATCNSCHMPPLAGVMNSANLERFESADVGVQGGWPRPHGASRQHSWWGPRQPEGGMLRLVAGLSLELTPLNLMEASETGRLGASLERVEELIERGAQLWRVRAVSENIGAGHGLPTGEPMRHLILSIELLCDGERAELVGGDVVHGIGGALTALEWQPLSMLRVPDAQVGDLLRVTRALPEWVSYEGYGPFGSMADQRATLLPESAQWVGRLLSDEERGLQVEHAVGELRVTAISEDGRLSLSDRSGEPVDELWGQRGDRVWHQRQGDEVGEGFAGGGGFTFARVLINRAGQEMVPHFVATDLTRDNRLQPGQRWRSEHLFSGSCEAPTAVGHLIYRPYPLWLAKERGWTLRDEVMATAVVGYEQAGSTDERPSYPTPLEGQVDIAIELNTEGQASLAELKAELTAQGVNLEQELEGDPLLIAPLPTLRAQPEASLNLSVSHLGPESDPALLTQSAWAQDQPSVPIQPGEQQRYTLSPRAYGASSYEIRREERLWRGALVSLPEALLPLTEVHQLTLGRAEARAATRRALPWPWRVERGELSARPLTPDATQQGRSPLSLDLSVPQILINQSSIPALLDVPHGVIIWGGDSAPATLSDPTPRSPQRPTQHPLALLLAPGEGVILWATSSELSSTTLYSLGMTAHGGRAWGQGGALIELSIPQPPSLELLSALGINGGALSPNQLRAEVSAQLRALLGEPLDLDAGSTLERFTALPPLVLSSDRHSHVASITQNPTPPLSARWVYQGDRRSGRWRVSGGDKSPQGHESRVELRNLSAQGHTFSVEGHLHQLITERGERTPPRAVSWIPVRGRALIAWPAHGDQRWRAGALHSPEMSEGLSTSIDP